MFFVDAAHFVWQGYVGFLWCFFKIWFGSPSGRKRFNVLGALNAVSHEVITVCNDSYIESWSVLELLWKLRARYLLTGLPISIVVDNASYQRSEIVRYLAKLMRIELVYLPPYSPNLNLIERLWKFVRKKSLASKQYDTFVDFCLAIQNCVEKAHMSHAEELESVLVWNFQVLPTVTEWVA